MARRHTVEQHNVCPRALLLTLPFRSPAAQTQSFMKPWVCGTTGIPVQYTPYGRSWNINDGTMGTTANAVFLANVYGQVRTDRIGT